MQLVSLIYGCKSCGPFSLSFFLSLSLSLRFFFPRRLPTYFPFLLICFLFFTPTVCSVALASPTFFVLSHVSFPYSSHLSLCVLYVDTYTHRMLHLTVLCHLSFAYPPLLNIIHSHTSSVTCPCLSTYVFLLWIASLVQYSILSLSLSLSLSFTLPLVVCDTNDT